jgi:hypothetical protein
LTITSANGGVVRGSLRLKRQQKFDVPSTYSNIDDDDGDDVVI